MAKHGNKVHHGPDPHKMGPLAYPSNNAALGRSHWREGLEAALQNAERLRSDTAQHGRLVHVLMENGKPCNKWVEVDFNSRSGFSKKQLPKGQMEPLNL